MSVIYRGAAHKKGMLIGKSTLIEQHEKYPQIQIQTL